MNINSSQVIGTSKVISGVRTLDTSDIIFANEKKTTQILEKSLRTHKKQNILHIAIKRFLDIVGSIVGIIILIPLTIMVIIANKMIKDNGPLFFIQERIGKNGKIFKMYKFRSMVVGADEILEKYLAENEEAREEYRINKKLKNDPRITKVGSFLRKTSLDEWPQFINVLKGEMSLVGPRPYLPREKEEMGTYYNCIVSTRPGLTGFWQVNGRSGVTFEDRLNMDVKYYNESCLTLDTKLLFKTIEKVVKKEGAA